MSEAAQARRKFFNGAWFAILSFVGFSSSSIAVGQTESEAVEFACARPVLLVREKTPPDFKKLNPDKQILECSFRLSATVNVDESVIDRIEYFFLVPEECLIVDYLPKTSVGSEVAAIDVQTSESNNRLQIQSIDGGASVGFSTPVGQVAGSISTEQSRSDTNSVASEVRMSVLPPKVLVTAASTLNEGRGLKIRLQQRSQITLQGDKDYVLLLEVPKDFEIGYVELKCSCFFKNDLFAPIGKQREIQITNLGTERRDSRKPNGWTTFKPTRFAANSPEGETGSSTSVMKEEQPEKPIGIEALEGVWDYEIPSSLGKFSGRAEIKAGKLKLLSGTASFAGVVCTITGNAKDGFSISQDRNIGNVTIKVDGKKLVVTFNSLEEWHLTPSILANEQAWEKLTK